MNANTEASLMGPVLTRSISGCSLDDLRTLLPMVSEDTFAAVFETLSTFEWWSDLTLFLPTAPGDVRALTLQLPDPKVLSIVGWKHGGGDLGLVIRHGVPPWWVIWQTWGGGCSHTAAQVYDLFVSMGSLQ